MNNKVKFLRGTSDEYAVAEKDSDAIYFTTDDGKLYIGDKEVSGDGSITIDNTLSYTSTNPVQNKVVKQAIDSKADSSHTHVKADITDFPESLPANGGNADTVDGKHANDFSQIIQFGTPTDTKTAIGIFGQTTTYWCSNWTDYPAEANDGQGMIIAARYNGDGTVGVNAMWVRQLFISPHYNYKIWQRLIVGTTVGEWTNIADGGNADTLDGKHANDFIYARGYFNSIDLDDIKYPCSGLALNCAHSPSSQWGTLLVYAGGTGSFTQIYIPTANDNTPTVMYFRHYGGTGWTAWRNTADGGNADTIDGLHAWTHGMLNSSGGFDPSLWFICQHNIFGDDRYGLLSSDGKQIRCHYASEAYNAALLGGVTDAYHLGTLGAGGDGHGGGFQLSCQHNVFGDNRFVLQIANRTHEVRVDYATNADTLDGLHASDIITSSSKPYETGTFTKGSSSVSAVTVNLGFIPSIVIWGHNYDCYIAKESSTNSFVADVAGLSASMQFYYIAFK